MRTRRLAILLLMLVLPAVHAAECEKLSETCAEPEATRVIGGVSVTRPCWRYEAHYRCETATTEEEPYCQELRDRGCSQVDSTCTRTLASGACAEYEQTYRCPAENAQGQTTTLECGGQLYCLGGDCFSAGYQADGDFALAASYLGAVDAAAHDLDPADLGIFRGDARRCEKTFLGFSNCCKDAGWGVDLGLAQCSESERLLAQQNAAGQCHFVGSYSEGSFLTERKYHAYCCFHSKLARILQEQGRPQLGIRWDAPEHPDCRALTPQELTAIDFSRIDFSEFYADALAGAAAVSRPTSGELGSAIKDRIERLLPQ